MEIRIVHNINPFQIFQTLRFGAFILISIVLAKTGASTDLIGNYEYLLMIGGSAAFFWLGGYLTYYLSKNKQAESEQSKWFGTTFYTLLIFNLAVVFVMLILFNVFHKAVFEHISADTFLLFLGYHFFNNITYINEHYLLAKKNNRLLVHYGIINFLAIAIGAILGYELTQTVNGLLMGLLIVSILKFIPTIFWILREKAFKFPALFDLKFFLKQGALISTSILLGSLGDYLDEYLVRYFYGDSTFAVYKMGAREFPLLQILTNSLATVLIVLIAQEGFEKSMVQIKQKTSSIIRILTPLMCFVVLGGKWLFPFFYNEHFQQSALYFNLYALLCFSRFLFPQSVIIGLNLNKYLIWASVAETILHLTLSLILINIYGIYGVIAGFLISALLDKILLAIFVYKKTGKGIWHYTPLLEYAVANGAILLSVMVASAW